jgi:hypothetical protein
MVDAACAEFLADLVARSEPKVGDSHSQTAVKAENILGLQIPVINTPRMTELDCVEQLNEDVFDEPILAEVSAAV